MRTHDRYFILDFPWQRRNVSEKAVVVLVEDVKISD